MDSQRHETRVLALLWKVPVVAVVYFVGAMVSGALVAKMGLHVPEMPGATYVPLLDYLSALVLAV